MFFLQICKCPSGLCISTLWAWWLGVFNECVFTVYVCAWSMHASGHSRLSPLLINLDNESHHLDERCSKAALICIIFQMIIACCLRGCIRTLRGPHSPGNHLRVSISDSAWIYLRDGENSAGTSLFCVKYRLSCEVCLFRSYRWWPQNSSL